MRASKRKIVLPISGALAASIGILLTVMLVLVQWMNFDANEKNTFELLSDKARGIVSSIELGVRNHLSPKAVMVEKMAPALVLGQQLLPKERLEDLFVGGMVSHKHIGSLHLFDKSSRPFGFVPDSSGRPVPSPLTLLSANQAYQHPELERIIARCEASSGTIWHRPQYFSNSSFLVVSHPVRAADRYLGCLATTVSVRDLSEFMGILSKRYKATPFILYGTDHVLAHPELTVSHVSQNESNPLPLLAALDDPVLKYLYDSHPFSDAFSHLEDEGIDVRGVELGDEKFIFLTKTVSGFGDVPLTVGAWFPHQVLDRQVTRLIMSVAAGVLLLIVGIVLAVFMGRKIASPIKKAARASSLVGKLDLEATPELPSGYFKELNEQAKAFNNMLHGLKVFGEYVPHKLVERLIREDGIEGITQERELTVMFTDVSGFTTLSESLPAADVAAFLNHHFGVLGEQIEIMGGTIDKFIGDALMAFWGAPELLEDAPCRACLAALAMRKALEEDNARQIAEGGIPTNIRIGIHTGPVVVGNIGAKGRINYTIVGDAVNTTQRLEALGSKHQHGAVTILISEETRSRLADGFVTESLGFVRVKGRTRELEVHRLLDYTGSKVGRSDNTHSH